MRRLDAKARLYLALGSDPDFGVTASAALSGRLRRRVRSRATRAQSAACQVEHCDMARSEFLTSDYRCGHCDACKVEGTSERLDEGLPCGFYCDCVSGWEARHDAYYEAKDRARAAGGDARA